MASNSNRVIQVSRWTLLCVAKARVLFVSLEIFRHLAMTLMIMMFRPDCSLPPS